MKNQTSIPADCYRQNQYVLELQSHEDLR